MQLWTRNLCISVFVCNVFAYVLRNCRKFFFCKADEAHGIGEGTLSYKCIYMQVIVFLSSALIINVRCNNVHYFLLFCCRRH